MCAGGEPVQAIRVPKPNQHPLVTQTANRAAQDERFVVGADKPDKIHRVPAKGEVAGYPVPGGAKGRKKRGREV